MSTERTLGYGNSAAQVSEFIKSLDIIPSDNLDLAKGSTFNISAVQVAFREHTSLEDYIREMDFIISQAVKQRAHLICFPAFSGFLPAPLFPQYERILKNFKLDPSTSSPDQMWIYQAITGLASECMEVFTATMSGLAEAYRVYIMAGSIVYSEAASFKHRAFLFDYSGNMVGVQDKISTGSLEKGLHVEQASEIRVFETMMGNVSILIGDDVNYFETAQIAKNLGADIILNPTAFVAPYTGTDEALGLNIRAQENSVYGVQSVLMGRLPIGLVLGGYSGFYGPVKLAMPRSKNTMFLQTIKHNQTQIVTAKLALQDLYGRPDPFYHDKNSVFINKYINMIY